PLALRAPHSSTRVARARGPCVWVSALRDERRDPGSLLRHLAPAQAYGVPHVADSSSDDEDQVTGLQSARLSGEIEAEKAVDLTHVSVLVQVNGLILGKTQLCQQ